MDFLAQVIDLSSSSTMSLVMSCDFMEMGPCPLAMAAVGLSCRNTGCILKEFVNLCASRLHGLLQK